MKLLAAVVVLLSVNALALDAGVAAQDGGTAEPRAHKGDPAHESRANALIETLRKMHKGPPPCFRWDRGATVTSEAVASSAVALQKAGIKSDELPTVVPMFIKWANELDDKVHKLAERDEVKAAMRELAPPEERAKIDKNPQALDVLADRVVSKPVDFRPAEAALAKWPKAKQDALKAVFKAHAVALRLAFLDVTVALQKLEKPESLTKPHDDHGHQH